MIYSQMTFGQMVARLMTVSQRTFGLMTINKMTFGEMTVDKMIVGQMSIDQKSRSASKIFLDIRSQVDIEDLIFVGLSEIT
jgi:hypothetical protein